MVGWRMFNGVRISEVFWRVSLGIGQRKSMFKEGQPRRYSETETGRVSQKEGRDDG